MPQTGSYSVNLLGSIASNLAGLQGYDVMALELIQNADDAKASSISFDITDDALVVENNGAFSYCEDLGSSPCPLLAGPDQYACDFHRITNLASGGKARRSENIGRFGIGFVSTYQLCDHPQIHSTGVKVTLQPEQEKFEFVAIPEAAGTRFVLPWATDPDSLLRQELRMSAVQPDDLDQVETDIARMIDGTLLFLNHLKTAELRRNGQLIRSCKLTRDGINTIILEFGPEERLEMWLLVKADASEQAITLTNEFPQLEADDRRSDISVAFRLDTEPLQQGLFYAFLPTEQFTGLPLHINADFYPEPDRKSIVLSGGKHQQRWNEMLISAAANEVAVRLDDLKTQLGADLVWDLLQRAWTISEGEEQEWQTSFWAALETEIDDRSELAWTRKKQWAAIGKTILPSKELSKPEERLINDLGLELADDGIIKRAQVVLQKLGTVRLSLKRLAEVLRFSRPLQSISNQSKVKETTVRSLYEPLWRLIDRTAADLATGRRPGDYFNRLPILLTVDQRPIVPVDAHQCIANLSSAFAELLPELDLISADIYQHAATRSLADELTLDDVSACLTETIQSPNDAEERFGRDGIKAHKLYRAMADLHAQSSEEGIPAALKSLPIFLTGDGFTSADTVSLPGDFNDPIGFAHILDSRALDLTIENFFEQSIGIAKLEIDSYITNVLPNFFEGAVEPETVNKLLTELADHRTILDNDELVSALGELPLIPTQDGEWHRPNEAYYKTEALVEVLGNNLSYWVDEQRLIASRSIRAFVEQLGLLSKPSGAHLGYRILEIATNEPNERFRAECERAFYAACYMFDDWKRNALVELETFVSILSGEDCLPAYEDNDNWYSPEELYAPYRLEAFSSQAPILPFRNLRVLKAELLEELKITNDPETELVVAHLRHCVDTNTKPHKTVYQILDERSADEESKRRIATLAAKACIYDESRSKFLRPNQLFRITPNLGDRALKVPKSLERYSRLFDLLDIKETPTPLDHLAIATDIIDELGDTGHPLPNQDQLIFTRCLETIANSLDTDEELELAIKVLRNQACILNLKGKLCYPDEIAIRDSDWHESYFGNELSGMLTAFRPELQQLYRMLGVQYLSQKVRPVIGQKLGDEPRIDIAEQFQERARCIVRALHDRPRDTLIDLHERLSSLNVVLCDTLDIMFVCELRDPPLESPETPEKAHYDASKNTLYISTPDIGEFAIPAFNSILHILATSPTGASIPNLVLICELVLDASNLSAAERKLSAAGFPDEVRLDQSDEDELEGGELGDLGTGDEEDGPDFAAGDHVNGEKEPPRGDAAKSKSSAAGDASTSSGGKDSGSSSDGGTGGLSTADHAENEKRKKDRGRKRQDRLLSYVIPKGEEDTKHKTDPSILEHNLTVEDRGRAAVVLFEKQRGRDAIPQAQENPGWDIVSTDISGAVRYIEVKAIDGEWGKTGVGLSKLQFSEAQNYHNDYWLYVVEFAGHESKERVFQIQSPATKVTTFMFDHNWQDIADTCAEDERDAYKVGARIKYSVHGEGTIIKVDDKGHTRMLKIDFDRRGEEYLALNMGAMKILPPAIEDA